MDGWVGGSPGSVHKGNRHRSRSRPSTPGRDGKTWEPRDTPSPVALPLMEAPDGVSGLTVPLVDSELQARPQIAGGRRAATEGVLRREAVQTGRAGGGPWEAANPGLWCPLVAKCSSTPSCL